MGKPQNRGRKGTHIGKQAGDDGRDFKALSKLDKGRIEGIFNKAFRAHLRRNLLTKKKGETMILRKYLNTFENCEKFGFSRKSNAGKCLKAKKYPQCLEVCGIVELHGFYFVKIRNSQNCGGLSLLGKRNNYVNFI